MIRISSLCLAVALAAGAVGRRAEDGSSRSLQDIHEKEGEARALKASKENTSCRSMAKKNGVAPQGIVMKAADSMPGDYVAPGGSEEGLISAGLKGHSERPVCTRPESEKEGDIRPLPAS